MQSGDILFLGLGNAGGRIVDALAEQAGELLRTAALDCDAADLEARRSDTRVQVGRGLTSGRGAGGDAALGQGAVAGEIEKLRALLDDTRLLVTVAGLGGGLGSGGLAPVLKAASDSGAATLCLATLPFDFEGAGCMDVTRRVLPEIRAAADALVIVPNDKRLRAQLKAPMADTLPKSDAEVGEALRVLWQLLTRPAYLALDYADLLRVTRPDQGVATMAWGDARGRRKADSAVQKLLASPLIGGGDDLADATGALVNIVGGPDLTLDEVGQVMAAVQARCGEALSPAVGASVDEAWKGRVTVSLILSRPVTGYLAEVKREPEELPLDMGDGDAAADGEQQTLMMLESTGRGRFQNTDPNLMNGEDLDIPTYQRRGLRIEG